MNRFVRSMTLLPCTIVIGTSACQSDVKPVGDALAQDSTLALDILGARPDSAIGIGDTIVEVDSITIEPRGMERVAVSTPVPAVIAPAPPSRTATTPAPNRRAEVSPQTAPRRVASTPVRRATSRPRAASARRTATVRTTAANVPARRAAVSRTPVASSVERPVASRAWLVLPAGSQVAFASQDQICNGAAGDNFEAEVSGDVVAANGVIIPAGASARGEIIAASANQPAMEIQWISFNGRMYAVKTRVTHVDTKRVRTKSGGSSAAKVAAGAGAGAIAGQVLGRDTKGTLIGAATGAVAGAVVASRTNRTYMSCVPDGGRIVAELTEPLRIQLSE